MKNRYILLVAAALALASCGGKGGNSSSNTSNESLDNTSSSIQGSSSYVPGEKQNVVPGLGGLPQIDDGIRHDPAGWTFDNFAELLENAYYNKENVKSYDYVKDVYLRSTSVSAKHEVLTTHYEYQQDRNLGDVMTGRANVTAGNGVINTQLIEGAGYGYDIQSYAAGGYLHYLEKVIIEPGTKPTRVSYDSVSKNNRYNNLYTIYSANPDKSLIRSAYQYVIENYDSTKYEMARYIDTSTNEVIMKMAVEEYSAYTDYMHYDFVYVHADKTTRQLTRVDYGWIIYDVDGKITNDKDIQTIRVESVYNLDYSPRSEFKGTFLTEKDVDKVYGGPAQHPVDYSSWKDGVLSEENTKEILANLQSFGSNTLSTRATFSVDQFVDPANSVDIDGEFNILGALRGSYTTTAYKNDFVETKGSAVLSTESGVVIDEFDSTIQAEANDDGMYVIEKYNTDKLYTHKHTWKASEIDDTDPYIGVNPIFRDEIFHPFRIVGNIGPNNPGVGDDDEELPTNFYSSAGSVIKNGKNIQGNFTKIYHKNIWTPYWTYTASFTIEDGFLSEIALNVISYYETDSSTYTIRSSFSFANTKGTPTEEFKGVKLDPKNFEESSLLAKNERLYK